MPIELRSFEPQDHAAALALWQRCDGVGLSAADSATGIARFLERNPGLSLVALREAALVGTILVGHDGRRGYLYHLAVDPALRGQGLGRRLVDAGLARLRACGIDKCHAHVFAANASGRAFWQAMGAALRTDLVVHSLSLGD